MDNQIVYLDEGDLRRSKMYWGAAFAILITSLVNGVRGYNSPGWETHGLVTLILSGLLVVAMVFASIILSKPERRPHILMREDGIRLRQSYYKSPQELNWDQIETVDIKPNLVEIVLTDATENSIKLNLLSFDMNKQVHEVLSPHIKAKAGRK